MRESEKAKIEKQIMSTTTCTQAVLISCGGSQLVHPLSSVDATHNMVAKSENYKNSTKIGVNTTYTH